MSHKHIERDIFGDDDDEDDQVQGEDRDVEDRSGKDKDDSYEGEEASGEKANASDTEDDEEDEPQLPSFRKRNADGDSPAPMIKKKKSAKKAKPSSPSQTVEGEEGPLDPRQQALLQLEKDFDLALKSGKSTSRRRRKDEEDIDTELDESAARFVAKMREAAFNDLDHKVNRQAALAKVRMLESVKTQLNKSHLHNTFLDNGILEAMTLWLEPLQDSSFSLPSLDIIQDFLAILDVLPIQTDHLVNSKIGRVVYFYTKVDESRVTPAIKRQAHALVDKWSRPIVKLSQDYRDKKINYAEGDVSSGNTRRRHDVSSSSSAADAAAPKTLGVRVPQIDRGAYALMPESSIQYDKSRGGKSDKYKKLKSHMAKMKQVKRS